MPRAKAPKTDPPRKRCRRTVDIQVFCLKYLENNAQIRPTAKALKISVHTIYKFLQREDIDAHLNKAREKLVSAIATQSAKKYVLDRSDLDVRLIGTFDGLPAKSAKPEIIAEKRRLLSTGYVSLGLGQNNTVINANSAVAASAASPAGDFAKDVYEAIWLRERKAGWSKELEQKHGNPAPQLPPG